MAEAIEDEPPHVGPPETIYDEGGVQIVSTEDEGVIVMVNGERVADGFFARSADAFCMEKSSKSFYSREELAQHYGGARAVNERGVPTSDIIRKFEPLLLRSISDFMENYVAHDNQIKHLDEIDAGKLTKEMTRAAVGALEDRIASLSYKSKKPAVSLAAENNKKVLDKVP